MRVLHIANGYPELQYTLKSNILNIVSEYVIEKIN